MKQFVLLLTIVTSIAAANPGLSSGNSDTAPVSVTYLANEGVLITHGDDSVLIDPLFTEDFDTYLLLDERSQNKIIHGEAPFDNIDVVLISHVHDDHFNAELLVRMLLENKKTRLAASPNALEQVRADDSFEERLEPRLTVITPELNGAVVENRFGRIVVQTTWQRHSSTRYHGLVNLAHQVLIGGKRILHLGDAEPLPENFANLAAQDIHFDLALVPIWFFGNDDGQEIILNTIDAAHTVAFHAPTHVSREQFENLAGERPWSIFLDPFEHRALK